MLPIRRRKSSIWPSQGRVNLVLQSNITSINGNGHLKEVSITAKDKTVTILAADHLIPLFGLTPKLGPIADWGLTIDKSAIQVDTTDYSTNVERIYAIGDINTYPGKLKLFCVAFTKPRSCAKAPFATFIPIRN